MIPPQYYTSPQWHEKEISELFRTHWIFVGLKLELQGLSHLGIQVGDRELVIQLDANEQPHAYQNACAHRMSRLCTTGLHTGPIRCPYHGWVYDKTGVPAGIPHKNSFPEVLANPSSFKLIEYPCDSAGQFIFIRLSEAGPSLKEALGAQFHFLEKVSASLSHVDDQFEETVNANWKVVIENSLEGYHVPLVHSKTFMKANGMDSGESAPSFFFDQSPHSYLQHTASPVWLKSFSRIEKQIGQWPWKFDHYTHHHIFPNMTLTSFLGYSYHIQFFNPLNVNQTAVQSRTLGVHFKNTTSTGKKMIEKIYKDGHDFTRKVFYEDAIICNEVQMGLNQTDRIAILGVGIEDRVKHFQSSYLKLFS